MVEMLVEKRLCLLCDLVPCDLAIIAGVIKCEKLINKEKMEKCSLVVPTEEVSLFQTQYQ